MSPEFKLFLLLYWPMGLFLFILFNLVITGEWIKDWIKDLFTRKKQWEYRDLKSLGG